MEVDCLAVIERGCLPLIQGVLSLSPAQVGVPVTASPERLIGCQPTGDGQTRHDYQCGRKDASPRVDHGLTGRHAPVRANDNVDESVP